MANTNPTPPMDELLNQIGYTPNTDSRKQAAILIDQYAQRNNSISPIKQETCNCTKYSGLDNDMKFYCSIHNPRNQDK